jgi:hypothetical protein
MEKNNKLTILSQIITNPTTPKLQNNYKKRVKNIYKQKF